MQKTIRVVVADDHPLIRAGMRLVIEDTSDICLVGATSTTDTVTHICTLKQAHVLLLDIYMPGVGLAATLEAMRQLCPGVKVIILSAVAEVSVVQTAVSLGVCGYILKEEAPEQVTAAIRTVMGGAVWYSMSVLSYLVAPSVAQMSVADLNERELQVLRGIAQGLSSTEIAEVLNLHTQTIRNYASRLYDKIGVNSRTNAIRWALQHGLASESTLVA